MNETLTLTERHKAAGFINEGFGAILRETKIAVYIVFFPDTLFRSAGERFGVYISHGSAGGEFWKNSPPIVRKDTLKEAKEVAETIYGYAGSGEFATIIYRDSWE